MAEIANGARVRLKSGGPLMTAIVDNAQGVSAGQPRTVCMWFDQEAKLHTVAIPTAALSAIDQPTPDAALIPIPEGPDLAEVQRDITALNAHGTARHGAGDEQGWIACRSAEETMSNMARMLKQLGHPAFAEVA